jgi:hypothetical protein
VAVQSSRVPAARLALVHPVAVDAPEPEDGTDPEFAELAADLSDTWLVEIGVGEDGDDACFGPLTARAACDLAVAVDGRRRRGQA